MFKTNQDSEMSDTKFGVGSVIMTDNTHGKYLVIGATGGTGKSIAVLNLETFLIEGWSTGVVNDFNHFTATEARMVVDSTLGGRKLQWTFTDFDLSPNGWKPNGNKKN